MEQTSPQKMARILRVMVIVVFACNLIALLFVPPIVGSTALMSNQSLESIMNAWFAAAWPKEGFPFFIFVIYSWLEGVWEQAYTSVLTLFLLFCGVCTAVILWQGKRVLDTILKGNPFVMDNARSLKRAAVCCFAISGAALARLAWGFACSQSIAPLLTYNALFVPMFLMGGLLFMVMSALFRQAAELKAENDLTI